MRNFEPVHPTVFENGIRCQSKMYARPNRLIAAGAALPALRCVTNTPSNRQFRMAPGAVKLRDIPWSVPVQPRCGKSHGFFGAAFILPAFFLRPVSEHFRQTVCGSWSPRNAIARSTTPRFDICRMPTGFFVAKFTMISCAERFFTVLQTKEIFLGEFSLARRLTRASS